MPCAVGIPSGRFVFAARFVVTNAAPSQCERSLQRRMKCGLVPPVRAVKRRTCSWDSGRSVLLRAVRPSSYMWPDAICPFASVEVVLCSVTALRLEPTLAAAGRGVEASSTERGAGRSSSLRGDALPASGKLCDSDDTGSSASLEQILKHFALVKSSRSSTKVTAAAFSTNSMKSEDAAS